MPRLQRVERERAVRMIEPVMIISEAARRLGSVPSTVSSHHHHHPSLNCEGRWGTTDDFTTSFLHFSQFSTALWDLPNSRPVHSLMLSSQLFLCLPCFLPPFTVPCRMVLAAPDERETCPYHCSLRHHMVMNFCADPYSVSVPIPVLPQWHVKDPGHPAESASGRLHPNTHTLWTQRSRSGLTILSRHSAET